MSADELHQKRRDLMNGISALIEESELSNVDVMAVLDLISFIWKKALVDEMEVKMQEEAKQ